MESINQQIHNNLFNESPFVLGETDQEDNASDRKDWRENDHKKSKETFPYKRADEPRE